MNDEKGRVHYQLSITGGQAGAFFLGLLVALCLAFFFGMKTGAASRRAPDAGTRLAAASDIQAPAPAGGADFTAASDAADGPARKKPAPTEPPLGIEEPPAVKPPVRGEPAPEEGATAVPKHAAAPKATAPPAPTTAPREAHAAPAPGGDWYVQVLATQKPSTADDTVKRLKGAGYSSDVSPVPNKPGLFRVRVGPYRDRASADEAAGKVVTAVKGLKLAKPIVLPAGK